MASERWLHDRGVSDELPFDELRFFEALLQSKARCLLIGRRALILLGAPVMTQDYDLWIASDDAGVLNLVAARFGLYPNRAPEEARRNGRYVLEGDERVDVLLARGVSTIDGLHVRFDDVWERRRAIWLDDHVWVELPSLDDLIATKRFGARPKDAEDILYLELLKKPEGA